MPRATPKRRRALQARVPARCDIVVVSDACDAEVLEAGVDSRHARAIVRGLQDRGLPEGVRVEMRRVVAATEAVVGGQIAAAIRQAEPALHAAAWLHGLVAARYRDGVAQELSVGPLTRSLIGLLAESPTVQGAAHAAAGEITKILGQIRIAVGEKRTTT